MSGGSFNYLCIRDPDELLSGSPEDLERMAETLSQHYPDSAAARDTQAIVALVRDLKRRLEATVTPLQGVWKAVEWECSGDWVEEDTQEAVARYEVHAAQRQEGAPE